MTRALPVLALLLLFPTLAHATLVASPARQLAEQAESTGAFRTPSEPSVAWNGDRGLVVWRSRVQLTDFVLASRVDANGMPLDLHPRIISDEGNALFSRVVPLGSGFLVVWQAFLDDRAPLRATFVDGDGNLRQLPEIAAPPFHPNDVASNGSTVLITGGTGDPEHRSALIWLDTEGQVFARKTYGESLMVKTRVRSNGTSFFVVADHLACEVYTCDHTFSLVRAEPDGTASEPRVLRHIDETQSFEYDLAGIAVSGDRVLVVFHEPQGFMTGMLFDHEGNAAAGPFPLEDPGASGVPLTVESDGQSFVIAYPYAPYGGPQSPVRSTRLRRIGASGGAEPQILDDDARAVALEWTGNGYLLARSAGITNAFEKTNVSVTRLEANGQPATGAPEYVVSRAPNQQDMPSSAWDGSRLFTAWEEYFPSEGRWKVKYGRNDANGNPLDGRGHIVSASSAQQRNPRVVFDGNRFLVLWTEAAAVASETAIRARRINADGSPAGETFAVAPTLCGADFTASRLGDRIVVAHLGAGCATLFERPRSVLVTYVEASDTASPSIVLADQVHAEPPVIAAGDANALVVWTQYVARAASDPCPQQYEYCPPKQVLFGAVIENGTARGIAIPEDGLMMNYEPKLAWNGQSYLVAWLSARDLLLPHELRTRTFSRDGQPAAQTHVLTGRVYPSYGMDRRGSVTATASGFLVAWQWTAGRSTLSLWRVAPNGAPIDRAARPVETEARDLHAPHLVRGPGTTSFLVYSLAGPDEVYVGHNRIVMRTVGEVAGRVRAVR